LLKRKLALLASVLVVMFGAAGCLDLFSVPGIALSPDGNQIVFLSGLGSIITMGEGAGEMRFDLVSANLTDGSTNTIFASDGETLVTAFAVNPTNDDVAFMTAAKGGGTTIQLYSAGSTRELVSSTSFGVFGIGTMMAYSPDGSKLALTMLILPPEVAQNALSGGDDKLTSEQAKAIGFVAYMVDANAGTVTPISNLTSERANTVAWNPSGTKIAYNAWVDSNGDGLISTLPDFRGIQRGQAGDGSQIVIYDVGSGSSTVISGAGLNFSQIFLSDDKLAFASLDFTQLMRGGGSGLNIYDLASGSTNTIPGTPGGIFGLSPSPDGSQIVWLQSTGDASGESTNALYVSGPDFSNPRTVTTFSQEIPLPDRPVWTADGSAVLISVSNVLAQLPQQISASFSSATGETVVETEGGIAPEVLRIDIASGKTAVVYTGPMINSSFFTGIMGMVTSGSLDQMFSEPQ